MNDFYTSALSRMKELKTEKPELREIADFYTSIITIQKKAYTSYKPDFTQCNTDKGINRNAKGLPFLTRENILFKESELKELFLTTCKTIRKIKEEAIPADTDFPQIAAMGNNLLEGLLENNLILEKMASQFSIEYRIFLFLTHTVFSPFITSYAIHFREQIDFNKWLRGYCPVCGGKALICSLGKDVGKKWLLCSLCFTGWPSKRLACVFCENENQETLRFFFDKDDETRRVDVCDKCKGYIKTIDLRKIDKEVNLFVENLSTLELDIVADKEGYKGGFNLLL